ncbi:MAG: AmmeMemoRadiSam system radical SAM enzyme [Pseudomonadota bacterium]
MARDIQAGIVPGRHWAALEDGRVECRVCPRYCRMKPGQRGMCFVRAAAESGAEDGVVLTSYGRSSGFCIDPIEKKPLNHFLPGTPVLSFGTAGCNLACKFCQNHDMSKSREMDRLMQRASPEMLANAARNSGCRSVAFTYNDPVIFLEYAVDTARACRARGVKSVAVTAGYLTAEARPDFFEHIDAANVDLKAFTERFYRRITGSALQPVLETLEYLVHQTEVWVEITTLLIPGENDSVEEIRRLSEWVATRLTPDVPVHFSAFHPDFRMLDKPRTPPQTLLRARATARQVGLRHVYVGNVHHKPAQSSYCGECGTMVIGRDWYELSDWRLDARGACLACGTPFPGVIDGRPGDWGRKRRPVRIVGGPA